MLIFLALLGCQPEVSTQSDGNRQALNQNNAQTIALLSEITVQDLVITEIMHNPEVESDWRGEWFEIYNAHTDAVDLQGLEVASANDTGFVVSGELIVQPGEYAVFANTSAADNNGGNAEVDYQYNYADLRFWDADSLSIAFQTTTFDSVSYDSAYPVAAGKSLSANVLDGSNNDTVDAWCRASSVYGDGDYGTPGFANDQCLTGDALTSGDLLITEIMHNPEAVADWKGEWFEIQNTSGLEINLNGLAFAGGSGGYTSSFSISDNLYLAPNAYFVFAVRAGDNGGLTADYYYDYNQMRFLDAGSIALSASGVVVDEVSWDSTWSLNSGVSLNLASQTSSSTLNDSSAYWCDATSTYGDGDYGTPGTSNTACTIDQDGDGFGALDGDCDDSNADVNSDAMEVCDGVDNDCDGLVDEDDPNVDLDLWYLDFDGDGYGAPSSLTIISCSDPNEDASYLGTPYVQNADDCDDFDISIYPGAEEIWYDGVDQNCDQASDFDQDGDLVDAEEDCDDLDVGLMSFIDDGDCDGVVTAEDCDDTDDTVTNSNLNDADCDGVLTSEDCDDADASVTNSNIDDGDCDGVVTAEDCDDTDPTDAAIFNDCDQDGSLKADDCNDSNPTIYPGAPELCDGLDNACTGSVPTNEDDADNDGYVECTIDSNGWQGDTSIVGGDDCDDIRPYIYVGAAYNELTTECTRDQDGDGWGAYAIWAGNIRGTDCDDADAGSTYQGVDGDCDGVVTVDDCDDADASTIDDMDCDGVLTVDDCDDDDALSTIVAEDGDCDGVLTVDDCDDTNASRGSSASDQDCDGWITEDDCDDSDPNSTGISEDFDCDGVLTADDCDDDDFLSTTVEVDADCDTILYFEDCDDSDASTIDDMDCDGVLTADDCDDNDALSTIVAEDGDCDGVLTVDDCDDSDATIANTTNDGDCDGVVTAEDCDDTDASVGRRYLNTSIVTYVNQLRAYVTYPPQYTPIKVWIEAGWLFPNLQVYTEIQRDFGPNNVIDSISYRNYNSDSSDFHSSEQDNDADGTIDSGTYNTFDSAGNLILSESYANGVLTSQYNYGYDVNGNLISRSIDSNGDGDFESITTSSFYADQSLFTESIDNNGDGVIDQETTYVYYASGGTMSRTVVSYSNSVTEQVTLYNLHGDQTAFYQNDSLVRAFYYTYDSSGNTLTKETDSDGDGNIDSSLTFTYDLYDNITAEMEDTDGDGIVDIVKSYSRTYDVNGNVVFYSYDTNGDALIDREQTYNGYGQIISDEVFSGGSLSSGTYYTFDETACDLDYYSFNLQICATEIEKDTDGDGVVDECMTRSFVNGRMVSFEEDLLCDGVIDSIEQRTLDQYNNPLTYSRDEENDGVYEAQHTYSHSYACH